MTDFQLSLFRNIEGEFPPPSQIFKGDVHDSVLRIGSAHNKSGPADITLQKFCNVPNFF